MNVSPIIVLDFETTGVSPEAGDRITEVAALRIVEGEITERFVSLINCGVNVPYYITKLTGITQDMVNHVIYAELSGDFPLGDSRQPTYKSLRPFDLVS